MLGSCLSPSALDKALKSLPRTLDETYERILLSIPEEHHGQAFSALQFLAFATQPTNVEGVAEVVAVRPGCTSWDEIDRLFDPHDILTICSSLVATQENHSVQLAHYSVKEYLLSPRILGSPAKAFYLDYSKAHKELATLCVDYIRLAYSDYSLDKEDSWSSHSPEYEHQLVFYAAFEWFQHARLAENDCESDSGALGARLLGSTEDPVFLGWRRSFLSFVSVRGRKAPYWSSARGDPNQQYGTPLCWAAFLGLSQTLKLFLDQGADVNEPGRKYYCTPLQAAAYQGFPGIVKTLLDYGADINKKEGAHGTALQAAFESRDPATVALLLNSGADVNAQCGYYHSPLQAALTQAMPEFVPRLISLGADVNAQGGQFGTALQAAARYGHEIAVELLIQNGADINANCGYYGNPLQAAAKGGHSMIVRRLLGLGADPNAKGGEHRNAFRAALCMYELLTTKEEVLTMLVCAGAHVPADSLFIAIHNDLDANIVELIINHDPTIKTRNCDTEMNHALRKWATWRVVELLMDRTVWNPEAHVDALAYYLGNRMPEEFGQRVRDYHAAYWHSNVREAMAEKGAEEGDIDWEVDVDSRKAPKGAKG